MASKRVWSGILPLSIILALAVGIFILGRIGKAKDETVTREGTETVGVVIDESERMVRIRYNVDGREYTSGVGKPHSYLRIGEEYRIKYLPLEPKSVFVFFDKPILSEQYEYSETSCKSMSKSFSVINFQYEVDGKLINRESPFREQSMYPNDYVVKYRVNDPEIGYLVKK
jgi:hypothetical protein